MTELTTWVTYDRIMDGLESAIDGTTFFSTRVYLSLADRGVAFPYLVYTPVSAEPFFTFTEDGYLVRVQVSGFADATSGPRALIDGMDEVRTALHSKTLTVTNHEPLPTIAEGMFGPIYEAGVWRMDTDYLFQGLVA